MEKDNLFIYNAYKKVPKEALKPFDNGNFKGTDINAMWRIKSLTEAFGVVGFGWTTRVLRTWTEQGENGETMAFAEIEMKVKIGENWSEPFTATGGNLMVRFVKGKDGKPGYYKNNDEAFKMAVTDAFGVACKYLGIGADVYWENDRSKYTDNASDDCQEPIKSLEKPTMTYEQALEHICEVNGMTIKAIYKDPLLRAEIPNLYKKSSIKTRQAFDIVKAEIRKHNEGKN